LPKPLALVRYEGNVVVVELVGDISKERGGDSRILERDNSLLVNYLLNLAGVCLEGLKVSVLRKNLNPVLTLWTSIASPLGVELVHSIHGACGCCQYTVVCVVRHVNIFLKSIIRFRKYLLLSATFTIKNLNIGVLECVRVPSRQRIDGSGTFTITRLVHVDSKYPVSILNHLLEFPKVRTPLVQLDVIWTLGNQRLRVQDGVHRDFIETRTILMFS
jgi:hypothetical protein